MVIGFFENNRFDENSLSRTSTIGPQGALEQANR